MLLAMVSSEKAETGTFIKKKNQFSKTQMVGVRAKTAFFVPHSQVCSLRARSVAICPQHSSVLYTVPPSC